MSQSEEREKGLPPSKTTLSGEHDSRTKAKSPVQQERPDSPEPSCVSMKSDRSMGLSIHFKDKHSSETQIQQERPDSPEPSCVSMKSDRSMKKPPKFKRKRPSETQIQQERPDSPEPSCVSMKSDWSNNHIINFKDGQHSAEQRVHQERSEVPSGQSAQEHQTDLDSIFMLLEENIVTFVKNELKRFHRVLSPDYPECSERQREDEEVVDGEEEEQRRSSREAFLQITLHFLRRMKQEELADSLQS
uniref:uncharacterized protein n=1 Tax=Centroberyx gerrardi TaxID=166262 RepID=UPI003AAD6977